MYGVHGPPYIPGSWSAFKRLPAARTALHFTYKCANPDSFIVHFSSMKYLFIILHGLTNGGIERKEEWGWEGRKDIREVSKSPGSLGPYGEGGRMQGVEKGGTAVQQKAGVLEGERVALVH